MSETENTEGRCISCGFLAQFDSHMAGPPPHFYEYPVKDRENGGDTYVRLEKDHQFNTFPRCYRNCIDLWGEIDRKVRAGTSHRPIARMEVFNEPRQCQKWYQYTPGFSPQEHWEEIRMLELELRRQEFEKKMADDQNAIMLKLDADQKEHMRMLDSGNKRFQLILGCVLGGIAVLEIIVGVLQVVYPAGFPWLQNLLGIKPHS